MKKMGVLSGLFSSHLKQKPSLMSRRLTTRNYKIVFTWGDKRPREKGMLDHYEIITQLGIGHTDEQDRSLYSLKLDGVKLHESLLAYGLHFLKQRGYKFWMSPLYEFTEPGVRVESDYGDYPNPDFSVAKRFGKVTEVGDESSTIAPATTAPAKCSSLLPFKYFGRGMCRRTNENISGQPMLDSPFYERINQFSVTSPTQSSAITEELINNTAILCEELLVPYQILYFSGSPLSLIKEKYELQAWFPASQSYVTVAYSSNLGEHNARLTKSNSGKHYSGSINLGDERIKNVQNPVEHQFGSSKQNPVEHQFGSSKHGDKRIQNVESLGEHEDKRIQNVETLGEHHSRSIKYRENFHFVNSTFMDINRLLFSMLENYQTIKSGGELPDLKSVGEFPDLKSVGELPACQTSKVSESYQIIKSINEKLV